MDYFFGRLFYEGFIALVKIAYVLTAAVVIGIAILVGVVILGPIYIVVSAIRWRQRRRLLHVHDQD